MELELKRRYFTEKSTIGEMYVDTLFQCFTLEDRIRAKKVPGETAIPEGRYEVTFTYSDKYKKKMPILVDVPNFQYIRIHIGNYPKDTMGCILVGLAKDPKVQDKIIQSTDAFNALYKKLYAEWEKGNKIWITITSVNPPAELLKND